MDHEESLCCACGSGETCASPCHEKKATEVAMPGNLSHVLDCLNEANLALKEAAGFLEADEANGEAYLAPGSLSAAQVEAHATLLDQDQIRLMEGVKVWIRCALGLDPSKVALVYSVDPSDPAEASDQAYEEAQRLGKVGQ